MSFVVAHIGELAALATALGWTATAIFFAEAGHLIGSLAVSSIRLMFAVVLLSLMAWLVRGQPFPFDANGHIWLWLALSGVAGFAIGDLCLFRAFVVLGPRLATLIMALSPPMTAVLSWLFLHESLDGLEIFAIALTCAGVGVTVTGERKPAEGGATAERRSIRASGRALPTVVSLSGVLLALVGALGQAVGLVLSKHGMGDYNAIAATQIRVYAGLLGVGVAFSLAGLWPRVWAARSHRRGLAYTAMGALVGPVLAVTLSLYAIQHTSTGVAASIMSTIPIWMLPISIFWYRERVPLRSILGAFAAVAGVVLLFA